MTFEVAIVAAVTVLAALWRRREMYPAALAVIALMVAATVLFSILGSRAGGPLSGLTSVLFLLLIVIDLVLLFGSARAAAARRARRARKANEAEEQARAARAAYVQQWQQAWSDANGGAAPPEGLVPPVGFGAPATGTNTMAILAIIFGFGGGLLGIVFGHIALSQIRRTGEKGRGLALTGLIFGYLGLAALIVIVIVLATSTPSYYF